MKKINLYRIFKPIMVFIVNTLFRPKVLGKENIPSEGRIILAGNHIHLFDCILLAQATNRQIYFLAKKELFKGPFKAIFNNLGCVPVNRDGNGMESITKACEILKSEECLGIFPEGTRNKTDNLILPFKLGTIMIAKRGKSDIVPFAITGKYRLIKNNLTIKIGEVIPIKDFSARDALIETEERVKTLMLSK